jgi:hypothetical protein
VKANVLFFERKPGSEKPWTKKVWVYDHRTNCHYTLKTKTMTRANLDEFVACYQPGDHHTRKPTWNEKKNPEGRWRAYTYDEIAARDKCSLDLFWLRDEIPRRLRQPPRPPHPRPRNRRRPPLRPRPNRRHPRRPRNPRGCGATDISAARARWILVRCLRER